MKQATREFRIMAIIVRSQRLGFAVLGGVLGLLDWRVVYYIKNADPQIAAAKEKIARLIHLHAPSVIVLCQTRLDQAHSAPAVESIARAIKRVASQRFIPVTTIKRGLIRNSFERFCVRSREDIAAILASMFPELAHKLPPRRKIWHGEHAIMTLFDAVALAVAYWDLHHSRQADAP